MSSVMLNATIASVGDSMIRNVYHQFNSLLEPSYLNPNTSTDKHINLDYVSKKDNVSVHFIWAPFLTNVTTILKSNYLAVANHDFVVTGVATWDALHSRDLSYFKRSLSSVSDELKKLPGYKSWILPTVVVDTLLPTDEKRQFMTQKIVSSYIDAVVNHGTLSSNVNFLLNPRAACGNGMQDASFDGIHYSKAVYDVMVQMLVNSYTLHYPSYLTMPIKPASAGNTSPKPTGSMSFPSYGAYALILAFIMLFTMDSFLGIGALSLALFGRSLDWNEAYFALHKKLGVVTAGEGVVHVSSEEGRSFLASEDSTGGHK